MKVDFNNNGFSASMNENENVNAKSNRTETEKIITDILDKKTIKSFLPFVLGLVALVSSLVLIPFGFVAHTGAGLFLFDLFAFNSANYLMAYIFMTIIFGLISVTFGVIACVLYKKGDKKGIATVGFTISILSFVINGLGITYNIIVMILNSL